MNDVDILKQIIKEHGNCCWASEAICNTCPLSRLKIKEDGNYLSCVESVGIQDIATADEADARYKQVAMNKLMDMEIENILEGNDVS